MTPIEKANELYSKFDNLFNKDFMLPIVYDNQLKECALIAVDLVLDNLEDHTGEDIKYWQEVQQEIGIL
jgi:hypothetical protein